MTSLPTERDAPAASGPGEPGADGQGEPGRARPRRLAAGTIGTVVLVSLMVLTAILAVLSVSSLRPVRDPGLGRPAEAGVVVAGGATASWDPARVSDAASAQLLAQVYEGLTALDSASRVQPALSGSWTVEDGGRRIAFRLRPEAAFSDGSPIDAEDVRRSWLRLLDPAAPSPLASLLLEVRGAGAYLRGEGRAEDVAIGASGDLVTVEFERPAAWFPALAASPTLAVVPEGIERAGGPGLPEDLVGSGAYVPVGQDDGLVRLRANAHYWAGPPAIGEVAVVTDAGGRSMVEVFQDGDVDWTPISRADAPWIAYDRRLGPQLRRTEAQVVEYLGFDTRRPPFSDPRVRRAVAMAVDWRRLTRLSDPGVPVATSLIPAGIPGRGREDFLPPHDPEQARAELTAAGYPGGSGFPAVTLATYGAGDGAAVSDELRRELGIEATVEAYGFEDHSALLDEDTPPMWTLAWSADYPHPNDFLGLLLGSHSTVNAGGWSDPEFDALLEAAASTADPAEQERLYAQAQRIVRDEVPAIPLRYAVDWSLAREGLLGAEPSGTGIMRYAGMAWQR